MAHRPGFGYMIRVPFVSHLQMYIYNKHVNPCWKHPFSQVIHYRFRKVFILIVVFHKPIA